MVDLLTLVTEDLGPPAKTDRKGSWWVCPFHDDRNPSLLVNEYKGQGHFRCWSCDKSGKTWEWLTEYRHLARADVYTMLHGQEGDNVRQGQPAPQPQRQQPVKWTDRPDAAWQDAATAACLSAAAALHSPQYARVLDYLTQKRGLTTETVQRSLLGYNPVARSLPDGSWLPAGITIPCWTSDTLWYVKVRQTRQEVQRTGQKYKFLTGSQATSLYNAERLKDAAVAVATEGEFDALLLQQEVPDVAVVTLGSASAAASLSDFWRSYLSGLDRLLVILDADDAGQNGLTKWQTAVSWCQPMTRPDLPGKDVTDWKGQGLDLWQWVSSHLVGDARHV